MSTITSVNEPASLVCIRCPRGCLLSVWQEAGEWKVAGNTCARGPAYGIQEVTRPMRVITALMRLEGAARPVSVKTDGEVPKDMIKQCVKAMYQVHPKAPVRCGDVLIEDLCGTGVRVVATRDAW